MDPELKKYLPFAVVAVVVVVLLVLRGKGGGGGGPATVINTGTPNTDIPPNQANLAYSQLNAQNFKSVLDYSLASKQLGASQQLTALQSDYANRQLAAQQSVSSAGLSSDERVQLAQIEAQRTIGLAAAQNQNLAELSRANAQLASLNAQQQQQQAANRQNALASILSTLQQLLRSQSNRPGSSAPNGGQSPGQTTNQRAGNQRRTSPLLPPDLSGLLASFPYGVNLDVVDPTQPTPDFWDFGAFLGNDQGQQSDPTQYSVDVTGDVTGFGWDTGGGEGIQTVDDFYNWIDDSLLP